MTYFHLGHTSAFPFSLCPFFQPLTTAGLIPPCGLPAVVLVQSPLTDVVAAIIPILIISLERPNQAASRSCGIRLLLIKAISLLSEPLAVNVLSKVH